MRKRGRAIVARYAGHLLRVVAAAVVMLRYMSRWWPWRWRSDGGAAAALAQAGDFVFQGRAGAAAWA